MNTNLDDLLPLQCKVSSDRIKIEIPERILKFATENHPDFWDGKSGIDIPNIKITDIKVFMKEVVDEINNEISEDGSTLLTNMLDKAITKAIENGCGGIDYSEVE